MSWSYELASLAMCGEAHVLTLSIEGRRWFCVVNQGCTAMVAAPAETNDGEGLATKYDGGARRHIESALKLELHPRRVTLGELKQWCEGGGYGDFDGLLVDRKLLKDTIEDLELTTSEVEWRFVVTGLMTGDERRLTLRAGDGVAIVMGLSRNAKMPRPSFPPPPVSVPL